MLWQQHAREAPSTQNGIGAPGQRLSSSYHVASTMLSAVYALSHIMVRQRWGHCVYPYLSTRYSRRNWHREVMTCRWPLLLRDKPEIQSHNARDYDLHPSPCSAKLLCPDPNSDVHICVHTQHKCVLSNKEAGTRKGTEPELAQQGSENLPARCHPALQDLRPPMAPLGLGGRNPHMLIWERPIKIF